MDGMRQPTVVAVGAKGVAYRTLADSSRRLLMILLQLEATLFRNMMRMKMLMSILLVPGALPLEVMEVVFSSQIDAIRMNILTHFLDLYMGMMGMV
jgi:hypothetical protein